MTIRNDASLRGKSKALAKKHGLSSQELIQMYLFERFLVRLSNSRHKNSFILIGGLLISKLIGISNRTTMDMDVTLNALSLNEDTVERVIGEVCAIDSDDGILFSYERCEPIRSDDDYGGIRAHLRAKFGRMDAAMKIDFTTGDVITPASIEYPFPMLFEERTINLMTYPIETCLAEKFEGIVKRGVLTTRARDLYDLACLLQFYGDTLHWDTVASAIRNTAEHRETLPLMYTYEQVCNEMLQSADVIKIWENYTDRNRYAKKIALPDAIEAVRAVGRKTLWNENEALLPES
jgi:predicted nucleotidyltransferase component of viral defense system